MALARMCLTEIFVNIVEREYGEYRESNWNMSLSYLNFSSLVLS